MTFRKYQLEYHFIQRPDRVARYLKYWLLFQYLIASIQERKYCPVYPGARPVWGRGRCCVHWHAEVCARQATIVVKTNRYFRCIEDRIKYYQRLVSNCFTKRNDTLHLFVGYATRSREATQRVIIEIATTGHVGLSEWLPDSNTNLFFFFQFLTSFLFLVNAVLLYRLPSLIRQVNMIIIMANTEFQLTYCSNCSVVVRASPR